MTGVQTCALPIFLGGPGEGVKEDLLVWAGLDALLVATAAPLVHQDDAVLGPLVEGAVGRLSADDSLELVLGTVAGSAVSGAGAVGGTGFFINL